MFIWNSGPLRKVLAKIRVPFVGASVSQIAPSGVTFSLKPPHGIHECLSSLDFYSYQVGPGSMVECSI